MVPLHLYHLKEIIETLECIRTGDVVNKEKSIGSEVGMGPQATILLLSRSICKRQVVRLAVDGASNGIRVL